MMNVYVTKWVLGGDKGKIKVYLAKPHTGFSGDKYYDPVNFHGLLRVNEDAFADKEAALANADKRRTDKIASLERQIANLKKMTFTVEE